MELSYDFELSADNHTAWAVLLDVPRIAPCLPGAEVTEVIGNKQYRGTASAKLGPIKLIFNGEAELVDVNNKTQTAKLRAKGSDQKGRGTADADVTFSLIALDNGQTQINVQADLNLAGSIAQYGRASGLIDQMARQIIAEFVENLESEMAAGVNRQITKDHRSLENEKNSESFSPEVPGANANNSISGFSLFFHALVAVIKNWLTSDKNDGSKR